MSGKFPQVSRKEIIAGIAALAAALVLLLLAALCLSRCTGPEPETSAPTISTTMPTTAPTLAPNPYFSGDFGYRDGYLSCLSGSSKLGVDVSSHQGSIDWPMVATQGVEFAMIRLGYRGWGNGEIVADERALANLQEAAAAGLQVGAYFYSQAVTPQEALEEARFVMSVLDGMALSMPVVFDWEIFSEDGRNAYVDSQTVNECARVFCEEVRKAGYAPMIYFNLDVAQRLLDLPRLQEAGYGFWLALYMDMTYPHRVDMWQYTASGLVKGIEGPVDLNLYFTYEE